ncbi:MAG TPA: PEP-CTERM sorting domain-containing protein, partial [Humisphaera sp.]
GGAAWGAGGTYQWEVGPVTATGSAGGTVDPAGGPGSAWDLLDLAGSSLSVDATAANPFRILVARAGTLSVNESAGDVWFTVARSSVALPAIVPGTVVAIDPTDGNIWQTRTAALAGGGFAVQVSPVPEPSAAVGLLAAAGGALLGRRRRCRRPVGSGPRTT